MSVIPEWAHSTACALVDDYGFDVNGLLIGAIAAALLAERERATKVERHRCEWAIRNLGLIVQDGTCYVARQAVIDAIRAGEEAGK